MIIPDGYRTRNVALRDRAGAVAVLRPLGDAVVEFVPAEVW